MPSGAWCWVLGSEVLGSEKNMSDAKSGILDENFLPLMLGNCSDDVQRGLVVILYHTGMHGQSVRQLSTENLKKEGGRYYLKWRRTKTKKLLEAPIPTDRLGVVTAFLTSPKKSLRWYNYLLRDIGSMAGFEAVSTMTFRHTHCLRLIKEGRSLFEIAQKMGCSQEVIWRNYSKLSDEQIHDSFGS